MTDRAKPPTRRITRRIPWFGPVPVTDRSDGWTAARQTAFIGFLAQTGNVRQAAAEVGKSRQTAYRLRTRPLAEGFVRAWDAALGRACVTPAPKVTREALLHRFENGLWRPVMRNRRFVRIAQKFDDTGLLRLLAHYDRTKRTMARRDAAAGLDAGAEIELDVFHADWLASIEPVPLCTQRLPRYDRSGSIREM